MEDDSPPLFDLTDYPLQPKEVLFKNPVAPVWTENKAQLISRYLRYFVFITHHGTYLDAFAGPQEVNHPDSWAARLVLESEPKFLRKAVLFELDRSKWAALNDLVGAHHCEKPKRTVLFRGGNMNVELARYLEANPLKPKEATFCLLDQHTFECDWATVETLARHKTSGTKIELFYFLAQGWLDRAVSGLKDKEATLGRWWGNPNWRKLIDEQSHVRGRMMADRFKNELGYSYSYPFPIYERDEKGGRIMFWMIHASDHPEAPKLMLRAYKNAVAPLESMDQLECEFSECGKVDLNWRPAK